jgi:hypothetical protein
MSLISNALKEIQDDFKAADQLEESIYQTYFAKYFKLEEDLYARFRDTQVPINDSELEQIITVLPLDLISAANALSQFRAHNEIGKLAAKQRKKAKDASNLPADDTDTEFQLMTIVYNAVISRVESQLSFSKELIMGAKKVWDAHRKTDQPVPIIKDEEIPEYIP